MADTDLSSPAQCDRRATAELRRSGDPLNNVKHAPRSPETSALRVEGGLPQGRRLRRGAGVAERRTVAPEAAPVAPPKSAP